MVARFRTRLIMILKTPMSDRALICLNKHHFSERQAFKRLRGGKSSPHCDNFKVVSLSLRFFFATSFKTLKPSIVSKGTP